MWKERIDLLGVCMRAVAHAPSTGAHTKGWENSNSGWGDGLLLRKQEDLGSVPM